DAEPHNTHTLSPNLPPPLSTTATQDSPHIAQNRSKMTRYIEVLSAVTELVEVYSTQRLYMDIFDDIESKSTIKDADEKAFEWNCPQCVVALVETLDKMILATDLPSNDPVRCNNLSIVGNQPGSSSAGNLNPISDGSTP